LNIKIEPMNEATALAAAEIEALCFSSPWPPESFINILNNNNALYLIALCDGVVAGYIGIFDLIDEFSIINVATHPDYRKKGIGRLLMSKIRKHAENKGCAVISLEVRESNVPARTLYDSLGYTVCGRIGNYYSDPKEDAILYQLEIRNQEDQCTF